MVPEYRDWSNREDELLVRRLHGTSGGFDLMVAQHAALNKSASTPKRLKRNGIDAMEGLLERHRKTKYARLLDIYCPRKVSRPFEGDDADPHTRRI